MSSQDQVDSQAGMEAQRAAITAECSRRVWPLQGIAEDAGVSGKSLSNRPSLQRALDVLTAGEADVLVVSKLDRLSRSLLDFATLLGRSNAEGWRVVILDLAVDTTTPAGEVMAHVAAAFAQYERRLISERTKAALWAVRAKGVRLGRPPNLPAVVVQRICTQRAAGRTLAAIAEQLDAEGVPTAQGGSRWWPATVATVLRSASVLPAG